MNSLAIDSGDEWDKMEVGVFPHCPTPMAKIGPTWVEVHAAACKKMRWSKSRSQHGRILLIDNLPRCGRRDWDEEEDSQSAADPQFKDAPIEKEDNEEVAGELPTEEPDEGTINQEVRT